MSGQHGFKGIRGGFNRPEFTPGTSLSGPRVRPEIGTLDGAHAEQAELEDQERQESLKVNRSRRFQLSVTIGAAVLLVALIVFGMVWLWADERWAQITVLI